MLFERSEILGNIVQLVIALRDERMLNDSIFKQCLNDHSLIMKDLQDNVNFLRGIWSGFTWELQIEQYFWRTITEFKEVQVVQVTESIENHNATPTESLSIH